MITPAEKHLYNDYLVISRKMRDKPFSIRKNFDDMDETTLFHIRRISHLLSKYPHITSEQYFKAPFVVYPEVEYFGLDYFSSMKAVEAYRLNTKRIDNLDPDDEEQISFIGQSLRVILKTCNHYNTDPDNYPSLKTGITYEWMKQVKKHEISIYSTMAFSSIYSIIETTPADEVELFLGITPSDFLRYRERFNSSVNAKALVTQGIEKIKKIIRKKHTNE